MTIEQLYKQNCETPSDINEHLPKLKEYADKCEHVTEIGVRGCVSLSAFLASNAKKVVAIDIMNVAVPQSEKLEFINKSSLDFETEETDFLFIDSLHTYAQLKQELYIHGKHAKKYIGFHDTVMFGLNGEDGGAGLNQAITEYIREFPEWELEYFAPNNNGLSILKRK